MGGLVLFIVYVGGTMVLFTYCLILSPLQFFSKIKKYYRVVLLLGGFFLVFGGVISIYEFYYFFGLLLMVGVLLFIVILRVVELIDFSRGTLRVEYDFLSCVFMYFIFFNSGTSIIHLVGGWVRVINFMVLPFYCLIFCNGSFSFINKRFLKIRLLLLSF